MSSSDSVLTALSNSSKGQIKYDSTWHSDGRMKEKAVSKSSTSTMPNTEEEQVSGVTADGFSEEDYVNTQNKLKHHCEQTWAEIKTIQEDLKGIAPENSKDTHSALVLGYKTRAGLLRAQTGILRDTEPEPCESDPIVQFEMVRRELLKSTAELKETLTLVQSEERQLNEQHSREEIFKEEKEQLKETLTEKLAACFTENNNGERVPVDNALRDIKSKEAKLKTHHRKLMKKVAGYINEHFPEPSMELIDQWRRKQSKQHLDRAKQSQAVMTLQALLEQLMNLSVDSPHDAYLELNDSMWPPYVELLLRSGIALRHPQIENRIRLTPFHL